MVSPEAMVRLRLFALALVLTAACDQDDPPEKAAAEQAVAEAKKAGEAADEVAAADEGVPDPCALLTKEMIRKVLGVPADTAIDQSRSKHSPHPLCSYSWSTLSEAEKKKQRADMVKRMMAKMKKGKAAEGIMDMAGMGSEEAHLTIYKKTFGSPEATQRHLDSIQKTMEKGIRSEVRGQKVEIQSSYEAVEGVGDKAIWNVKHSELSIAEGKRLYHVGAKGKDKSQSKALSKKLALAILDAV